MTDAEKNNSSVDGAAQMRSVALVSVGQLSATMFSFAAIIMVARLLTVSEFGVFSLFLATMNIGAEFSGKSIDVGMVRYASEYMTKSRIKANQLFREAFWLRVCLSLFVAFSGYICAPFIAEGILQRPGFIKPLQMASLGTIGVSFWWFMLSVLQANELFIRHAALNIFLGLTKVTLVALLFILVIPSLDFFLFLYVTIVLGCAFLSLMVSPIRNTIFGDVGSGLFVGLLHFSKWVVLTNITMIILNQQSLYWVGQYLDPESLGIYSSAWNLSLGMDILAFAMMTVFLPSISRIKSNNEKIRFIRQSIKYSFLGTAILTPFVIYSSEFITMVFSEEYVDASILLKVFFIGTIITLFIHPVSLLLITIEKPQSYFYAAIVVLLISMCANFYFIPVYGILGAAVIVALSKIIYGLLLVYAMFKHKIISL